MLRWFIILFPLLLTNVSTATAQVKIANHWYFGDSTNLDFSAGSPTMGQSSAAFTYEGCASYSDANGNLQFYTNGGAYLPNFSGGIWNANHVLMDNGNLDSANGCFSSRQGTFAFPDPTIPGIYHMLTTDCSERQNVGGLRYNRIDMNENAGLGKVVVKDSFLYRQPNGREDVHGILNSGGDGYWVFMVFRDFSSTGIPDTIVSFEVTGAGINGPFQQITNCPNCNYQSAAPNGRKYLFGENLFDINTATGQFSNRRVYPSSSGMFCSVFSPNSNLIYASQNLGIGGHLYQYRLDTTDLAASELALTSLAGFGDVFDMKMGPDGRLYLLSVTGNIGVVECPNKRGPDCNVNLSFMALPPTTGFTPVEFPTYPSHFFSSNDSCGAILARRDEAHEKPKFRAYPNPASGLVRVDLDINGNGEELIRLRLLSLDSREALLLEKEAGSFPVTLDLRQVPAGLYFLEMRRGDGYYHQRLLVE